MKKILIVGANSSLAKELIPKLNNYYKVVTAGRDNCSIYCDVTEPLLFPEGLDIAIHLAANFGGKSDEEIVNALKTNVLGTLNVCQAAKKANIKHLIIISSIFTLLDEQSPFYTIYSLTKKQADEMAQFYCKLNNISLTILKPSQIYGDDNKYKNNQPFFYHIMDKVENGENIEIYGNNDALRNYIHCDDVAEIITRIVDKNILGTYNCANPNNVSYSQIAKTAYKMFKNKGEIVFLTDKLDIPDNIFEKDCSLYEKINFYPQIDIEDGIKRIVSYRKGDLR